MMTLAQRVLKRFADSPTPEKRLTKRDVKDREYQKSPEYKTTKNKDYYPQKAPPGYKLPSEVSSLGSEIHGYVESMPDEDLDKNKAYSNRNVKAVQKQLLDRAKKGETRDKFEKEFGDIDDLKSKMSRKYMDAETDEEADKYRFAMRKLYQTWRAYNALFQSPEFDKAVNKAITDDRRRKHAGEPFISHEMEWDTTAEEWG